MNKKTLACICGVCFILSTLFFWQRLGQGRLPDIKVSGSELGKLCVSQVYPAIDRGVERKKTETAEKATEKAAQETTQPAEETTQPEKETKKADNSKPLVIIYHTHSTESYQPYSESNFHREKEVGTVRDVGNVLTKELQSLGIGVVHDKTIHDRPSYNQSYDRSLETITALQKKYPTAKYIIDLHRDAAAYSGNVGKTTTINGETVAKFSLVVGQNNANFSKLMSYAKKINKKAESMYKGFGGRAIEKTYRYNEYIADKYLLLEIGNNQNNIEEVKATGKYFAHVLAAVIEEEGK
ncbi:stage II sporulation protein P [Anaerovorax odorimutans]|uniref:Stage II sporulation protein P n=1 Tax=Anaerovorax odorimutans TaxID=109327 RepID=A0ABT1RM47_9FIRM|nr:stage II sporulation protein P [Anaerovorax odorimutans]MCQ4636240.1 stage II sporulation protein P [Anaerovorax odorimutans]